MIGKSKAKNEVDQYDSFYVSFNPDPNPDDAYTSFIVASAVAIGGEKYAVSKAETALCKAGKFLILNGDHRNAYKKANQEGGYGKCLEYFSKNKHLKSQWSN